MIALNHSFIATLQTEQPSKLLETLQFIEHARRRSQALPLVHATISQFETSAGPFLAWANRTLGDRDRAPLVQLLLRMVSGPFLQGEPLSGRISPPVEELPDWLQEMIRQLLGHAPNERAPTGLISPSPTGGCEVESFAGEDGARIGNWLSPAALDLAITERPLSETAVEVLRQAEAQMGGQLVVLPSALKSAEGFRLDCSGSALLRALLHLEVYATALQEKLSREQSAARYCERCGIEMSQESADTWKRPTRRRQRMFVAGSHGEQYFDMHAKPGNLTRVHVWVAMDATIYVGHCGRHLD